MTTRYASKPEITDDQIAQRAYEIWESRGCPEGDGGDDWETAKSQLEEEAAACSLSGGCPEEPGGLIGFFNRLRKRAAL